jgi:uncharacterized protein YcbK (DUF882 family)
LEKVQIAEKLKSQQLHLPLKPVVKTETNALMSMNPPENTPDLLLPSRRRLLKAAAGTLASMAIPGLAQTSDFWSQPRELWLYRPATRETVKEVYWADGSLVPSGYYRICQLLRDVQMNQTVQFDIVTLDIARGVYGWLQSFNLNRPIIVNSGYRHPKTNASEGGVASLRRKHGGYCWIIKIGNTLHRKSGRLESGIFDVV